ncbi:hypothetical protein [Actinomadura opuntiae]|uniref:hypothetical protein n=1 Tax=Actinomadura sp. OS1-43 TaxID=604315 RepID=UPI00255B3B7B|nr:hypothetical protein [Actinomadura sp. OS1-43]MDL4814358.1 hypothetical protein [Actinomadura sp. OS1-43]
MKRAIVVAMVAAGAVAGVVRRLRSGAASGEEGPGRWLTVTVNRPPGEFGRGLPAPLARLGDHIEVRTAEAPGGKGTELAARLREADGGGTLARLTGTDPRQQVRQALREAKSLAETGEVMRPDAPPTTRPTVGGRLMGLVTRRAGGEGRL